MPSTRLNGRVDPRSCITTPPLRRGRPRKDEPAPSSRQRSEQPVSAVSTGFIPPELPRPPTLHGRDIAVSTFGQAFPSAAAPNAVGRPAQIPPSVLGSYASCELSLADLRGPIFRPDASTSTAMSWQPVSAPGEIDSLARRVSTGLPNLNPELVRHLYDGGRFLVSVSLSLRPS